MQVVSLEPMEDPSGAGGCTLKEAAACEESTPENSAACGEEPFQEQFSGRTCGPWGPCVRTVCSLRCVSHGKDAHWSTS